SDAAEDSSADDESTHEAQAVEVDVAADVPDDADDSDNDIDYDDEGYDDGNESRYTAAASSAVPIEAPRNYRESILPKSLGAGNKRSRSTAFSSDFSPGSRISGISVNDLFSRVGKSIGIALCLYPVIGLGGCVTRLVIGGTPPHPMYQPQSHDQWLNYPV